MRRYLVILGCSFLIVVVGSSGAAAVSLADLTWTDGSGGGAAVGYKMLLLDNRAHGLWGVHGEWSISRRYTVGAGMYSFLETQLDVDQPGGTSTLDLTYGGVELGYVVHGQGVVHLALRTLVGVGAIETADDARVRRDWWLAVEPSAAAQLNLTPWARFSLAVGYLFAGGVVAPGLGNEDLSGLSVEALLTLGAF